MPEDFEKCVKQGGKVITIPIKGHKDEYMHICYDKNGKSHAGEVKTKNPPKAEAFRRARK